MNVPELLWWTFAALAFGGGIGVIAGRNPVASLMSLVLTLFSLGVLFILMDAHFIGAIQVIVYAGAIMVLFLFVIMLLNLGHDYRSDLRTAGWVAGGSVAAGVLAWLTMRTFTHDSTLIVTGAGMRPDEAVAAYGAVGAVAMPLLREYVVAFEVVSLLLLAAIIGAVLLAKRRV
ncbi:MAG TPA: NADH-quinone oxidoreductase subunit J [Longimicrobiales bacterium]|nr:NADH-quinone oxidoreductase subunit J [Longimicrobiales bacterium]